MHHTTIMPQDVDVFLWLAAADDLQGVTYSDIVADVGLDNTMQVSRAVERLEMAGAISARHEAYGRRPIIMGTVRIEMTAAELENYIKRTSDTGRALQKLSHERAD